MLILDGRLAWVGCLGGKRTYGAVLVDLAEVGAMVHGLDFGSMSARDFARLLDCKRDVTRALIRFGCIETVFRQRAGHRPFRIPPAAVKAFRSRYVLLGEASRARGLHHTTVKKALDAVGVRPAFDPDKVHHHIYLRSEVARIRS